MKIVSIVGARPQFVKCASISREIARHKKNFKNLSEVIIHTGQHFDKNMSSIFFQEMMIPKPNYSLGVNKKSHGSMTGIMIEKIEKVLIKEKPDWVCVYGDTNSTLAGAIAASKLKIKIAHIESGLRSFNKNMPEEINRILTDRISHYLFCPTKAALKNLDKEGVSNWGVNTKTFLSGDIMMDSALFYKNFSKKPLNLKIKKKFILCTIHREENTNSLNKLKNIISALDKISHTKQVILPLHPRTKKILKENKINVSNLTLIKPVGYLNMIWLLKNCFLVMTDSGGLQKEAYFFSKPCITMREETEWVELIKLGVNYLAGSKKKKILNIFNKVNSKDYKSFEFNKNLYGLGNASKKVVREILKA